MAAAKLTQHPWFDNTILVLIVLSSVALAIDSPLLDPESSLAIVLLYADWVMTILFTIEFLLKCIAMGFLFNRGAYLTDGWNLLDFVIVIVSIMSLAADGQSTLTSLRSLRTLRALRPLRIISRNPGLRLVVNALFRAIPSIVNVAFVSVLFFLIFGIVAVSYFKGGFNACQGTTQQLKGQASRAFSHQCVTNGVLFLVLCGFTKQALSLMQCHRSKCRR